MTFAISLHHIGTFRVRYVLDWVARVGGHPFTVEPGGVGGANAIGREKTEVGEGEGLGGYAGAIAEDAATGWRGEHGIAEAGDEVWGCSRFAQGSYKVCLCLSSTRPDGCGRVSFPRVEKVLERESFEPHTYLLVWD